MAFEVRTKAGELKINGVSLHTPAWRILDVARLWHDSPLRGEASFTPGIDGDDELPMFHTGAQFSLQFGMVGDVDHLGNAYAASGGWDAKWIGLASNLNYLRANVLTGRPLATTTRTRAATLQVPGEASPRTANVHAWLTPGRTIPNLMVATLELRIPQGAFL